MLKKVLLLLSGTLILVASSLYYINFSPQHTSTSKTYQYKKKPSTYQFQKLSDDTNTTTLPAAGSWQSDFPDVNNSNVLGIAGQFNFFAKNIDSTSGHPLVGNFATQNLATDAWRVNGISSKISYIQQGISVGDGISLLLRGTKMVLGQSLTFNASNSTLNNHTLESPRPSTFTQDTNGLKYIDIDSEFLRLTENSKTVAMNTKDNQPVISGNQWSKVFDAGNITAQNNVKYLTVKASDLPGEWGNMNIKGVSDQQQVVLTIDTSEVSNVSIAHDIDNNNNTYNKQILFNFYNVQDNSSYTGNVDWNRGTNVPDAILAPNASVKLSSTKFKGNIIAQSFTKMQDTIDSGYFSDVPVSVQSPTTSTPKLISVPDVDFGSHKLNSETSLIGSWKGNCQVSGKKGSEIKINVQLADDSSNSKFVNAVTWKLIKSDYSSGSLVMDSEEFNTNTPATITYWPWKDDGTGDLVTDWDYNKANKKNAFYDIQISNLGAVTEVGDYNATLKWTLVDSP